MLYLARQRVVSEGAFIAVVRRALNVGLGIKCHISISDAMSLTAAVWVARLMPRRIGPGGISIKAPSHNLLVHRPPSYAPLTSQADPRCLFESH